MKTFPCVTSDGTALEVDDTLDLGGDLAVVWATPGQGRTASVYLSRAQVAALAGHLLAVLTPNANAWVDVSASEAPVAEAPHLGHPAYPFLPPVDSLPIAYVDQVVARAQDLAAALR